MATAVANPAPHLREADMFPVLDPGMRDRIARYGSLETPPEGALLFERGSTSADFFVVIEGSIELLDRLDGHAATPLRHYLPGQFSGETFLLNGRGSLLTGRAGAGARLLRLAPAQFRKMMSTEADIAEILTRAFILRRVELIAKGHGGATILGSAHAASTHRLRAFLNRNTHPYRLLDLDSDENARSLATELDLAPADLPWLVAPDGRGFANPELSVIADALGINEAPEQDRLYDLTIVGAGPSGLAAAVYAASEGVSTMIVEREAPGGQAGTSSKIENYLGFPTGISGLALAGRAQVQAQKFGARLAVSRRVVSLSCKEMPMSVTLEGGQIVRTRALVVATGARYRRLAVEGMDRLEGRGVYYAATAMEAQIVAGRVAVVAGGGNSAGQAAVFLARSASHVHVVVRGEGLAATMSDYLVQRIMNASNITLHTHTEIVGLEGDDFLSGVTWRNGSTSEDYSEVVGGLFVMIGAEPNTDWLQDCLALDDKGFVLTGGEGKASPFATSLPGVFAVGDVRSGSIKRVASGVGEGSAVIAAVHAFLETEAD